MKAKEAEERIKKLEAEVQELRSQLLNLALQRTVTFIPTPAPATVFPQPPIYPPYPIITCGKGNIQGDGGIAAISCKSFRSN